MGMSSCIITLLLTLLFTSSLALSAFEQTVGDWNVKIRTKRGRLGGERIPHVIFPTNNANEKSKSKLDCRLSLYSNGTFTLAPSIDNDMMPMHGQWQLGRNPYCPTDRFYDDLLLESHPRVQKQLGDPVILQRVAFQFKCRIYGRHSRNPTKSTRMNHGVMLWKNKETWQQTTTLFALWRQRRVCASFTARPIPYIMTISNKQQRQLDIEHAAPQLTLKEIAEQSKAINQKDPSRRQLLEKQESATVGAMI
jgi:hypothetical protein